MQKQKYGLTTAQRKTNEKFVKFLNELTELTHDLYNLQEQAYSLEGNETYTKFGKIRKELLMEFDRIYTNLKHAKYY